MAVDYGDARTGVAISDASGMIPGESWTVRERSPAALAVKIRDIAASRDVGVVVLGYPRNMDGTAGPRAAKSEAFAGTLRDAFGLRVELWDERLTTVDANRILAELNRRGKKRKAFVDAVAACLILESYLASKR
jgi:putative Holliday junction resolvase